MPSDQLLQLGQKLARTPGSEIRVDPVLERSGAQLLEPLDGGLRERLELQIGKRLAAPKTKRFPQLLRAERRSPCCECEPPFLDKGSKAIKVDLSGRELDEVTPWPRHEQTPASARGQQLAQLRDAD